MEPIKAPNNILTSLGITCNILDVLPQEVLLIIAKQLNPEDLYKLLYTNKQFYNLIIPLASQFAKYYAKTTQLDVEKFMWGLFNYEHLIIKNKEQLFLKMLSVHVFSKTNVYENTVDTFDTQNDLCIRKFQAGMIYKLCFFDINNSLQISSSIISMYSYLDNPDMFPFLFKFFNKYKNVAVKMYEDIEVDIDEFVENGMTFEMIDDYFQQALQYGDDELEIYQIIKDDCIVDFLRYVSNGMGFKRASFLSGKLFDENEYTDAQLEKYNAVRYIIGQSFASHYILEKNVDIDNIPNFLENIVKLRSIGINKIEVVEAYLQEPTTEHFENIQNQMTR